MMLMGATVRLLRGDPTALHTFGTKLVQSRDAAAQSRCGNVGSGCVDGGWVGRCQRAARAHSAVNAGRVPLAPPRPALTADKAVNAGRSHSRAAATGVDGEPRRTVL